MPTPGPRACLPRRRCALLFVALAVAAAASTASAQHAPFRTLAPEAPLANQHFGSSVAVVADTDGDGLEDLLVGAPVTLVGGLSSVGRAYLYSGASGALLHTFESPHPTANGLFGIAVAGLADMDGDGRGDVLIGAQHQMSNSEGRAYVFSGATGQLRHVLLSPTPYVAGAFGASVTGLPDVDDDGVWELVVGAPRENTGAAVQTGHVHIFSGATGELVRTLNRPIPQSNRWFGWAVAAVPDADGDGLDDLVISGNPAVDGRAYLVSGADGAHLREFASPNPHLNNGHFGTSVAGLPDVDSDGQGDVLIGAPSEDGGASVAGRAYAFSGATGALLHTLQSPTPGSPGHFGRAVAAVPDLDGDGRPDLVVSASSENGGAQWAGRVHVFSSTTGGHLAALQSPTPRGGMQNGSFGYSVASASDFNGDGKAELFVGSRGESVSGVLAGKAYLFSLALATGAEGPPELSALSLSAVPNPAAGPVTLTLSVDRPAPLRLALYDVLGREVVRLLEVSVPAGTQSVQLDARSLTPGLYLARLTSGDASRTVRLVLTP